MKKFSNLTDAIFYQTICPVCYKNLKFQNISECSFSGEKVVLHIDTGIGDTIAINTNSGVIDEISITRDSNILDIGSSYKYSAFASTDYSIYNNLLNSPITVSCYECGQFSYRIKVQVELTDLKIVNVCLESESVSLEEDSIVHEIKNNYEKNETIYSIVYADGNDKKINIPLIPLNLDNPSETLERVKKLLIFS